MLSECISNRNFLIYLLYMPILNFIIVKVGNRIYPLSVPTVVTDRVHNIADVVPGVSIGPKFWDHDVGDTLAMGEFYLFEFYFFEIHFLRSTFLSSTFF